jgi:hypothetical protein
MNAAQKLAGFIAGLAVVFAGALGVGAAIGPTDDAAAQAAESHDMQGPAQAADEADRLPGGLMVSDGTYTLELATTQTATGTNVPLRFQIVDAAGRPLTRYATSHDKQLHLIVVRRDMVGFQHVHPVLDGSGNWSVPINLTRAGDYRVFADFTPEGGEALTLGADLHVAGEYRPQPLPAPATTARVADYTVNLAGELVPAESSKLSLSVTQNGRPVTDLQPYLGAYGHLVALRDGDLAYLHVHPDGHPGDGITAAGTTIDFEATTPTAGDYRLFLDFRHNGVVRTAEFTVTARRAPAPAGSADPAPQPQPAAPDHGHGTQGEEPQP